MTVTEGTLVDTTKLSTGQFVDLYKDLSINGSSADTIDLAAGAVDYVAAAVSGSVSKATFEANMNTLLTATDKGFVESTTVGENDAVVVTVTSGNLSGHKYLVIDSNASGTFTTAADFVIEITGSSITSLTTATFV